MAARRPQNGRWAMVKSKVIGHSEQVCLTSFWVRAHLLLGKVATENGKKMENNGKNSGPLTWLPLNHLNGGTCNADAYANLIFLLHKIINKNCWNQIFNLSVFGRKKFTNNV